jgi:16S rRNA (cytosine967-C5)-methyltransferase
MAEARVTRYAFEHTVRALSAAMAPGAAADRSLSAFFREHPKLGSHDRGLVAETVYAVLRHRRSLAAAAGSELPRDLSLAALVRLQGLNLRQLEGLLRGGEADLIARIKAHQAADDPAAVRHDLPDWLWERLANERGEAAAARLAEALKVSAPLTLRVNALKATRESVEAALKGDGFACAPGTLSPWALVLEGKPALQRHPLFLSGAVEVQDEGSQLLAELVAPRRGEMVADFCAGAGGKTLALGALMRSTGRLYAFDVSAARLKRLAPRLARSGLSNVHPVRIESENDIRIKRLAGKFDRVLVDAPCSGLGTLRRNPELKWRQSPADVAELVAKQTAILGAAARLVKPGGRLVYATCSVLRAENQDVIAAFLAAHGEFRIQDAGRLLSERGIAVECAGGILELLPDAHGCDGFFAALLERAN